MFWPLTHPPKDEIGSVEQLTDFQVESASSATVVYQSVGRDRC
jgi:hypothetical protein